MAQGWRNSFPFFSVLLLLLWSPLSSSAPSIHDPFAVYRVRPRTSDQEELLRSLWKSAEQHGLDFWKIAHDPNGDWDVMVDPKNQASFINALEQTNTNFTQLINDVEKLIIEREHSEPENGPASIQFDAAGGTPFRFDLANYNSYNEMLLYIQNLQQRYPGTVSSFSIGRTHGGLPIQVVKIGRASSGAERKPAVWIDAGIHAREWVAPAVAMYFIHLLATGSAGDPNLSKMVEKLDWYILPVVNPDGYEYSRSSTSPKVRLWRKNRSPASCRRGFLGVGQRCCQGVDLNRNFDFHFGEEGSSNDPCEEIYRGSAAFSEPESRAIRDFILRPGNNFKAFITMHSYSQIWMYPYGHKRRSYPTDVAELKNVAIQARAALQSMYGTRYQVGTGADTLYPASGGSDDWAKEAGIKYVYLLELRPADRVWDGFILNKNQILPTAKETWAGIQVVGNAVINKFPRRSVVSGNKITVPSTSGSFPGELVVVGGGGGRGGGGGVETNSVEEEGECVDKSSQCPWWAAFGGCQAWKDMEHLCPRSCKLCERGISTCFNERRDCDSWKGLKLCSWVQKTCRKTCDAC